MYMKRLFLTVILCSLGGFAAFAQNDLQPAAIVNLTKSEPITVKQFRNEVERTEKSAGRALNQDQRKQILDMMINEKLVVQAAERDKITLSENEINQQIQVMRNQLSQQIGRQPTEAEFAAAVKSEYDLEMPAFREQLRRQLIAQKYLRAKKGGMLDSAKPPTEDDIKNFYNLSKAQFVRPETVRLSLIETPYGSGAADKAKAKETADKLIREINSNPTKFDEVFLRGQAPNSEYRVEQGYLPRDLGSQQRMGSEFVNIAFNLKQGEVSRLIDGLRGYQLIKVTETYEMKNLELGDIVDFNSRMTVHDYIGYGLAQRQQQEVLIQATEELTRELRAGKTFQIYEKNIVW
jgi:parvulin-like peptidyl-prolyl isomerase